MKFSIITVTKDSARTIGRTTNSVRMQEGVDVEHIIKDGLSSDQTVEIARSTSPAAIIISQSDRGIYDAMNQGFGASTGDVIAFLNSDDYYADSNVLREVANAFEIGECDFVYCDILMSSSSGEVVREWIVGNLGKSAIFGRQIPHPGIFIRREIFNRIGIPFDSSYRISADLKQQLIIIHRMKCRGFYLNISAVIMEIGGASTRSMGSYIKGWRESCRAYNEVFDGGGVLFVVGKVLSKVGGLRLSSLFRIFFH